MHERALTFTVEQSPAGERLPQDDGCRVDVAPPINLRAHELFGGHIGELAFELPLTRRRQAYGRLCHAEVDHARLTVRTHQNVLR